MMHSVKLGVMQPYFLPYIGYWQLLNAVDRYVIYDDVNFIRGGWINRNRILVNGESKLIHVQMHNASQNKRINEIEVLADPIYKKKLLKNIEGCYRKAPFFRHVFPVIENVINYGEINLARYLQYTISRICEYLSIDTELIVSSTLPKNNELRGQDKILEICKILDADEYFNAVGGQALYSHEDFGAQGIQLNFIKTGNIRYKQFNNEFVASLSIIDVMMFNSVAEVKKMLEDYE